MQRFILLLNIILLFSFSDVVGQCGPGTPSFTVNMVGSPTGTYTSPVIVRNDTCCGAVAPDVCLKFTIFLDPNAMGINFGIASGAIPPGALFYQINCGPPIAVGTPICLSGGGPHILTFCKPGNNNNTYSISSIPAPQVPDSILIRSGCSSTLAVTGFSVPTINWNSIFPGPSGAFNSYLSCTSGCATVTVTPSGTPPPFVDYLVSGFGQSPCQANFYQDTIRVYFYNDLLATINPTLTTICFGQTSAVLTGTASGGLPAYTYSWSTGSTAQTVTVGPGTYTFTVNDKTGCPPTTATAVVNSFTLPIVANAGPDQTLCKSSPNATLSGTITSSTGGIWSGGSGTFTPSNTSLNTTYIPTAGEVSAGSVQLYLTTTGTSGCPPDTDTINISFQNVPIANAGTSQTVCANNNLVTLAGSVSGFTNTGQWSSSGTGTFASATNLNTTYSPSAGDNSNGSVVLTLTSTNNGVCPAATSNVTITITPSPTVNAGTGQTICSNGSALLNGSVIGPTTSGNWTTNGSGSFSPASNVLNATYNPSASDIAAGSVTLTLTSINNGNCLQVQDTIIITIKQLANVNAGPSQLVCANNVTVNLNGTINGSTSTGVWTTNGTGPFVPGNTSLNNNYFITVSDISVGVLTFTLTSTNNGVCPAVTDTMQLTITPMAVVNAGSNQTICSNTNTLALNGAVSVGSTSGIWSTTGTGSFIPNNTTLNATYSLSPGDISSGSVTFSLTSTNNGACFAVTDTVKIGIKRLAIVNAGPDQTLCSTSTNAALSGSVSGGSTSGIWVTTGTGAFTPGNQFLNTGYIISSQDVSNGGTLFILTSTNNGVCPAVIDSMRLNIIIKPIININADTVICAYGSVFTASAGLTGGSGNVQWTTSGTGFFIPQNFTNPVTYNFSTADINNGSVMLTFNSINNGPCGNASGSMNISIQPVPVANFSASTYTAYIPNDPITFTNLSTGANTYYWYFGDGNFSTAVNPTHNYPLVGYYYTGLIATNQFGCKDTTEQMITVISDIQFPNVFTPNPNGPNGGGYNPADLSNDVFFPFTSGVTEYKLMIFNRWGELLFESRDLKIGWDGYFNGKLCQQDTYVWKAEIKFFDGRTYNKTGDVTLLR